MTTNVMVCDLDFPVLNATDSGGGGKTSRLGNHNRTCAEKYEVGDGGDATEPP